MACCISLVMKSAFLACLGLFGIRLGIAIYSPDVVNIVEQITFVMVSTFLKLHVHHYQGYFLA